MVASMYPLICTQNSLSHIDYGIPLVARKSTDYRTSTGKHHDYIPEFPQHFDCRVPVEVKPGLLTKHLAIREHNKSTIKADFGEKGVKNCTLDTYGRAAHNRDVKYIQNIEEKLFKNPAPPIKPKLSVMKDSYRMCYRYPQEQDPTLAPPQTGICEAQTHERGVQRSIQPAEKGYTIWSDIYLTENQASYVPYGVELIEKAQEDFATFYNVSGKWKGFKDQLPGRPHGNQTIFDKLVFKWEAPCRFLARGPIKHICQESETEYQGKYNLPQLCDYFPYLSDYSVLYEDSLPNAGPWQNLCPPRMYRTEYSHIGTGVDVRTVVDVGAASREACLPPHQPCFVKVNTK